MSISISTAEYAPKNKKAEVDGVVIIAKPLTSASSLAALDLQTEAKTMDENAPDATEKAKRIINEVHEQIMNRFVNREDAERVFANLTDNAITEIYHKIIKDGEDA